MFSFCARKTCEWWLKWLAVVASYRRSEMESTKNAALSSAQYHLLRLPKEKQKLYHPALWECLQAATVKQESDMQRPIGRHK